MRRFGETQVMRLNVASFRIEPVTTQGEKPGWLSRHDAERLGASAIIVAGGQIDTGGEPRLIDNKTLFDLNVKTNTWCRRAHDDESLFPVSAADYRANKFPRFGVANPERVTNPFWLEMARRNWRPNRARLQFGDFAPKKNEIDEPMPPPPRDVGDTAAWLEWSAKYEARHAKEFPEVAREDKVWASVREEYARVALDDRRTFHICGKFHEYNDEFDDNYVFSDIVVTRAHGGVEIFAYPLAVIPPLSGVCALSAKAGVFILAMRIVAARQNGVAGRSSFCLILKAWRSGASARRSLPLGSIFTRKG